MTSLTRPAVSLRRPGDVVLGKMRMSLLIRVNSGSNKGICSGSRHTSCCLGSRRQIRGVSNANVKFLRQWTGGSFRSFSTSKVERCDEVAIKEKSQLEIASHKAESLAELAKQLDACGDGQELASENAVRDAAGAAQDLLVLTFPTRRLVEEIERKDPDDDFYVSSLHRSLLAVTSWCLALVPKDDSLLPFALDLERRARELSLPLHLPLYQSLVVAVASHYSGGSSRAAVILDVSRWASRVLEPVQSSFFTEPLASLIRQNKLQDAIILLKGISSQHDIVAFDYDATVDILDTLRFFADVEEDADAMELFLMINKSMIREASFQEGPVTPEQVKSLKETVAALAESERTLEEMIDLAERLASGEEEDDGSLREVIESILTVAGNPKELKELTDALKGRTLAPPSSAIKDGALLQNVAKVDPASGEFETVSYSLDELSSGSSDDEVHDISKEIIYARDSTQWKFPDVTQQLVQLNRGREVLYTSEYEDSILATMMEDDGDECGSSIL